MESMATPRFSITMSLANALARPDDELYAEIDLRYGAAEDLGFDTVFNLEHHFSDFIVCPDTMLLHAYVAARTERLRLSNAVIVAPWHNPIRLAEQITMVDLLSGGRVFPGLGRGTAIREHEAMGVDPETTRERFREAVDIIRLAYTGEPFDYDGPFHTYRGVTVRPRPVRGEIPLIGAAISPSTVELLAAMRMHLMMSAVAQPPTESLAALGTYRAAAAANGMDLDQTDISYHGLAWIADTDEQAYEDVTRLLPAFFDAPQRHYEIAANRWKGVKGYEYQAQSAELMAAMSDPPEDVDVMRMWCDQQFVGSPTTVASRIRPFLDAGFNHLSFYCEWNGTVDAPTQVELYRRLVEQVAPIVYEVEPAPLTGVDRPNLPH
jgi:alkanesulfonate monooxygenase SsuD/methylene tetrahydromethanopterin reductase-like flavin-dependent oxidoreductase (luciferase family)